MKKLTLAALAALSLTAPAFAMGTAPSADAALADVTAREYQNLIAHKNKVMAIYNAGSASEKQAAASAVSGMNAELAKAKAAQEANDRIAYNIAHSTLYSHGHEVCRVRGLKTGC